eukprot:TRINITY_DN7753_c0_g1_i1.p1 TRINITY_DN7753_c0_g1~~TRINITY_DN7753_c0_g1_i1.p1  ORF type:complete len:529 (+),score=97.97 TRINITY_DN7753_c0_g1_i1:143-1729(+)
MTEGIVSPDSVDEAVTSSSSSQQDFKSTMILGVTKEDYVSSSSSNGLRMRKVKSSSKMQDIVKEAEKQRRLQPDKPLHKPRDSFLSLGSDFDNFEGIFNWGILLLCMGGLRLTLENLNKYGIRVNPKKWFLALVGDMSPESHFDKYPFVYLMIYLHLTVGSVFLIERLMASKKISRRKGYTVHISNLILMLVLPAVIIKWKYSFVGPVRGIIAIMSFSITFLKLWSYIQVNYWCYSSQNTSYTNGGPTLKRKTSLTLDDVPQMNGHVENDLVTYPDNLTLRDLTYFWYAPTLCYELNFPRMDRIRKVFLFRRFLEVVVLVNFTLALIQQWIIPSVINSMLPFNEMQLGRAVERVLKLAIPNHLIWLIFFYMIFHSVFNTLGEVLRFADRRFYTDWWNAENIQKFWTRWNIPVHQWCVRHLYKPIIKNYGSGAVNLAKISVFFLSAFFHEYLISVPLGVMRPYAFIGMMAQLPLFLISSYIETQFGPRCGNMVVWMSLILGQPLALLMYYHDFVVQHYGQELLENFGTL